LICFNFFFFLLCATTIFIYPFIYYFICRAIEEEVERLSAANGSGPVGTHRKRHNVIEQRRREKINTKINELQQLLPMSYQASNDKASPLFPLLLAFFSLPSLGYVLDPCEWFDIYIYFKIHLNRCPSHPFWPT
jgi:hypothetical protein